MMSVLQFPGVVGWCTELHGSGQLWTFASHLVITCDASLYFSVRPKLVIPGFQLYFRFAETSDVPVLQDVLTPSANNRPLAQPKTATNE